MYSIPGYVRMIKDRVRMESYVRALRQTVRPGAVVLDLGAGIGLFALLACQLGARRVYAVEPASALQVARTLAAINGCTDRVVFIQELSTRVDLPERADIIVSDLRGVLPWFDHHLPAIVDARRRLLSPRGVLIPQCDTLWAAIVQAPDVYSRCLPPEGDDSYGLNLGAIRRLTTNTWFKARLAPEQLLVEPQACATLDYTTLEEAQLGCEANWTMSRAGTGHGLALWFDTLLVPGISFSNHPSKSEAIYGSAFFPWTAPVALDAGDRVSFALYANLVGQEYQWRWDTRVLEQGRPGQVKANFQQSTFYGLPLSPAHLRKRAANFMPALSEDGRIDRLILMRMDGNTKLEAIAQEVQDCFPHRFATWHEALDRVSKLSEQYSQ